jgi:hypothetical protein
MGSQPTAQIDPQTTLKTRKLASNSKLGGDGAVTSLAI